jgi:hypothetical protein
VPPAQRPTLEQAATKCEEALAQPAQEPVAWPKATPEEQIIGWTLNYKFLESLSDTADGRPSMETVESVLLLAVRQVQSIAPQQPAQERDFSCKVCGNKPNSDGELEHGKGCYTQDENGGGSEFISDAVTAPQPAQDWKTMPEKDPPLVKWIKEKKFPSAQPAQKREWVGLTDDEIAQGNKESWVAEQAWQSAVWWAEEILKGKNT